MEGKTPVLQAKSLGIQFGGLKAVDDFNIEIGESELVGLIGPNGAGKTTVFNLITGGFLLFKWGADGREKDPSDCEGGNCQNLSEHPALQKNDGD